MRERHVLPHPTVLDRTYFKRSRKLHRTSMIGRKLPTCYFLFSALTAGGSHRYGQSCQVSHLNWKTAAIREHSEAEQRTPGARTHSALHMAEEPPFCLELTMEPCMSRERLPRITPVSCLPFHLAYARRKTSTADFTLRRITSLLGFGATPSVTFSIVSELMRPRKWCAAVSGLSCRSLP